MISAYYTFIFKATVWYVSTHVVMALWHDRHLIAVNGFKFTVCMSFSTLHCCACFCKDGERRVVN